MRATSDATAATRSASDEMAATRSAAAVAPSRRDAPAPAIAFDRSFPSATMTSSKNGGAGLAG